MSLGISQVIGFKATVMFLVFACLRSSGLTLFSIPFLHASLVDFLVSITSLPSVNLPLLLGKSIDGRIPIWSILVFSPFFCLVRFFAFWWSFKGREAPYSEICEGLYVGGWPSSLDKLPPNDPAIIDCTCELPRNVALSRNPYLCIPTWDTRAPRPLEIEYAVRWACQQRAKKRPVFIHCAHGRGRSVSVMCALLVTLGVAEDWKNAEKIIRERRPSIRVNALHRKSLEEWSKLRMSSLKFEPTWLLS